MKLNFFVDDQKCVHCDACVKDCPSGIIRQGAQLPEVAETSEGACIQCQHCLAVCPTGAISVFDLKPEDSLPLIEDAFPTQIQMKTLLRGRRSVRQFRDENISTARINELLADIAHAPTGCNDRDLIFSVVDDRAAMRTLLEKCVTAVEVRQKAGVAIPAFLADAAAEYRRDGSDWLFRGAPHLLVVSAGNKATCGAEDVIIALSYFELLAQCAGIGTTWCGVLKFAVDAAPALRKLFGLDANAPFYAMMFGYPSVQYARTVQRDTAAVVRRIRCS